MPHKKNINLIYDYLKDTDCSLHKEDIEYLYVNNQEMLIDILETVQIDTDSNEVTNILYHLYNIC